MPGTKKAGTVATREKAPAQSAKAAGAAKSKAGDSSNLVIGPRKPTGPGKGLGSALMAAAKKSGKKVTTVANDLTAAVKARASAKGDDNTNLVIGPRKPTGPRKDLVAAIKTKIKSGVKKVDAKRSGN